MLCWLKADYTRCCTRLNFKFSGDAQNGLPPCCRRATINLPDNAPVTFGARQMFRMIEDVHPAFVY